MVAPVLPGVAAPAASGLGAGALVGAGLEIVGGLSANTARRKEARRQESFQERMANTAYQRAAADLRAAGLNRILAVGSPAATPSGAMAPVENALKGSAASARDALMIDKQIDLLTAQAESARGSARDNNASAQIKEQLAPISGNTGGAAGAISDAFIKRLGMDPSKTTLREALGATYDKLRGYEKAAIDAVADTIDSAIETGVTGAKDFAARAREAEKQRAGSRNRVLTIEINKARGKPE